MEDLVKTGKGILYYAKREIVFTQEDLKEVIKIMFGHE
jgi:hypothetical protein